MNRTHIPSISTLLTLLAGLLLLPLSVYANAQFFTITNPIKGTQWANGQANTATWQKGLLDDVNDFDIQLTRLSTPGVIQIARGVPAKTKNNAIALFLTDVPPADDYFLLFLNSTHGVTYTVSPRFSIIASGKTPSGPAPPAAAADVTVSVSGGPDPTMPYATTFPPVSSALRAMWPTMGVQAVGMGLVLLGAMMGGVMAVW